MKELLRVLIDSAEKFDIIVIDVNVAQIFIAEGDYSYGKQQTLAGFVFDVCPDRQ